MKIISEQKRSLVYFNEKEDTFIKIFKPKFLNRLKYFLDLENILATIFSLFLKN